MVRGKDALGVDPMPRVALFCEMIDQRWIVCDARLLTLYEMWKIVILFEPLASFGKDGMQLPLQRAILDIFDLPQYSPTHCFSLGKLMEQKP